MKIFRACLILYVLMLGILPSQVFAQFSPSQKWQRERVEGHTQPSTPPSQSNSTTSETSSLSLTPPDTDLSFSYLSNIFGTVDGVLSGNGSQLLGAMFGIFNGAVLVLGGIVILYTLFVSTLNTAHEGEMLGKRWSSIWIPFRSVMGIALLIPKASGYSFIQIFMVYIAVMGIGAADSVWNKALDYFLTGGVVLQQNQTVSSITNGSVITDAATNILRGLTCTLQLQHELNQYRQANSTRPEVPDLYQGIMNSLTSQQSLISGQGALAFPTLEASSPYALLNGVCGTLNWQTVGSNTVLTNAFSGDTTGQYNNIKNTLLQSRAMAVESIIGNLYPTADRIVQNFYAQPSLPLGQIIYPSTTGGGSPPYVWGAGTMSSPKTALLSGTTASDASNAYFGIMAPTLNFINNLTSNQQLATAWIAGAKQTGWALAGRFYFDIIELNGKMDLSESDSALTWTDFANPGSSVIANFLGTSSSSYIKDMQNLLFSASVNSIGAGSPFIRDVSSYGNSVTYGSMPAINAPGDPGSTQVGYNQINSILQPVMGIGGDIQKGLLDMTSSQANNNNPILSMAKLGNGLVGMVFATYLSVAVIVLVVGFALGLLWGFGLAAAFVGVVVTLMGLFTPILIPLMVVGLMMVFYIPIIPFIVFLFGVIGWFISVIEAVIAAPLVALGIAHPEGQEILGKAEPAVILLVNVFLRPTFMIFGLLIGMMLSYIGIWLLNQGFYGIFNELTGSSINVVTQVVSSIFAPMAFLIIYVLIAMQVVQKSFSLIYLIPDEVLKWIGGNIKGMGGEEAAEGKIASGYHGAAEAQSSAASKMPETSQGMMKSVGKGAEAKGFPADGLQGQAKETATEAPVEAETNSAPQGQAQSSGANQGLEITKQDNGGGDMGSGNPPGK